MFKPLVRRRLLTLWDDTRLEAGKQWFPELERAIERADVAVLLVSKHFLASDFISDFELPTILRKSQADGMHVFWLPIGSCMVHSTDLVHLQAAHDPQTPLNTLNQADRDLALMRICENICKVIRTTETNDLINKFPETQQQKAERHPSPQNDDDPTEKKRDISPSAGDKNRIEQNLLFGALAVQMAFIDSRQLAEVCVGWAIEMSDSIADMLQNRGWISATDRKVIEDCSERKLRINGGDFRETLAASMDPTIGQALRKSRDPNVRQSLDQLKHSVEPAAEIIGGAERFHWSYVHDEGALGEIWVGKDKDLDRIVAIKQVNQRHPTPELAENRLVAEAKIAGQLEHPNIVPVYELGQKQENEQPFCVMRMLRGPTLSTEIARHHSSSQSNGRPDPVDRRRLLDVFVKICNAIAFAHSKQIIHLDIKPDNIVLGEFGEVNVVDWGLARRIPNNTTQSRTDPPENAETAVQDAGQGTIGTLEYLAPEQMEGKPGSLTELTDVFGLGSVLYEILTGTPPHETEKQDENQLPDQAPFRRQRLPEACELNAFVPKALGDICSRAMATNPTERYPSAVDLSCAVQRWLDEEPLATYKGNVVHFEKKVTDNEEHTHRFKEALARNLVCMALVQSGLSRKAAAEHTLLQAISHYKSLVEIRPKEARYLADLAACRLHLYYVLLDSGQVDQAESVKYEAVSEYKELRSKRPDQAADVASILSIMDESLSPDLGSDHSLALVDSDASQLTGGFSFDDAHSKMPADVTPQRNESNEESIREDQSMDSDWSRYIEHQTEFGTIAPGVADEAVPIGADISGPRYRMLRPLAEGGLGRVYIALDQTLNREVAIKEIRKEHIGDSGTLQRFLSEVEITAALEHPGVVPVYSLESHGDGRTFYAMKYIKGHSLKEDIADFHRSRNNLNRSEKKLRFEKTLRRFVEVCYVVAYAHSRGVIHRDIKPTNVMIGRFGETLLIDWGLAKSLDASEIDSGGVGEEVLIDEIRQTRVGDTLAGKVIGTPSYMSPEQAVGQSNQLGPATDIFSLGATLYTVLTSKPPYSGSDASDIIQRTRLGHFPLAQLATGSPENWKPF